VNLRKPEGGTSHVEKMIVAAEREKGIDSGGGEKADRGRGEAERSSGPRQRVMSAFAP